MQGEYNFAVIKFDLPVMMRMLLFSIVVDMIAD